MNKILITGVAGFLGSNLAKFLLEDENNIVYGIDNLSKSSMTNIYTFLKNPRFYFTQDNLENKINTTVDKIYHLAGCGDFSDYLENKYDFITKKIEITKSILNFAHLNGSKILFISSYRDYQQSNMQYVLFYDYIRMIQSLILEYSATYKLDCKIAKITDGYGLNMQFNDKRFIPSTIMKAFNNEEIEIDDDRALFYTYSDDIIKALYIIMENYSQEDIIEVSSNNLHLQSDIAKLICSFTKSKSQITVNNPEIVYPNYKPDTAFLNNNLNYQCQTPILDGISKTIDYFKLMYFS